MSKYSDGLKMFIFFRHLNKNRVTMDVLSRNQYHSVNMSINGIIDMIYYYMKSVVIEYSTDEEIEFSLIVNKSKQQWKFKIKENC